MNLDELIRTQTSFVTEIEEIVDVLYTEKQVYLYDTSAISSHEIGQKRNQDLTFFNYTEGAPILLTDTIAKEMRLLEDQDFRYLTYLSNFRKVLYVKEENLFDLLKVDYELTDARKKFIIASERAFSNVLVLKERVREARKSFSRVEQIILSTYQSFFLESRDDNRGEYSLLWVATIIEQLPGKQSVTFTGIDQDLYKIVENSYFSTTKVSHFSSHITFLSNDTLLQSLYRKNFDKESLTKLVPIYRKPDRKIFYHYKISNILNLQRQNSKISNEEFIRLLIHDEIEVIY